MPNLYPTTRPPQYGYKSGQQESVLRNDAQSPKFQEKDLWNRTIFRASLNYDLRTDDVLVVYGFWKQMRKLAQAGSVYTFDFFDFTDDIYFDVVLGTASGAANQVFDIPSKKVRLWSWFDNTVLQSAANATLLVGTGVNGRDQIRITPALTAGHTVTLSYTGQGCFTCIFMKQPEKTSNAFGRQSLQVELMEKV